MNYQIPKMGMISGMSEARKRIYKKYIGKSGRTWLVPIGKYCADRIHVSDPNPRSQGYGGATLTFKLDNGEEINLSGPWHSNADALFEDTGIDVRDKHENFIVISESVDTYPDWLHPVMINVLYKDEEPQESEFDRGEKIAKDIANKLNKTVHLYVASAGGSRKLQVEPDKKVDSEEKES